MSKVNDKYKLPKTRVALPILGYTLIFILILATIFAVLSVFVDYIFNVRSETEIKAIFATAKAYEAADDKGKEDILKAYKDQGISYCIVDNKGNVLQSNGDITCEGFSSSENKFNKTAVEDMFSDLNDAKDADKDLEEVGVNIDLKLEDTTFRLNDTKGSAAGIDNVIDIGIKNSKTLFKDADSTVSIPYWAGVIIRDSEIIFLVKTEYHLSGTDYGYMIAGVSIAAVVAIMLFILMIASVISNLNANKKMKKIMFRDNIVKGHNWLWFVMKSQEILEKRRNYNKTYAVVELVFVKYRNFVLCHSVIEAEDLLRKVATTIISNIGKGELCAHSTSSALPLLLEVQDEADARRRINSIISALEKIPCGHKLAFRAGVCLVNPVREMRRMGTRVFDADIDLYYNNACAAGLSIADSGESGIAFFDDKLVEEEKWIDLINERQQSAIDNEEFLVYYQPKYDPRTNELMGAEALIRWKTEDMGLVSPGRFIPIFEENGFITHIDHYMVSHVARDQKKWLDEGRKCVPVSVNISRAHFTESNLAEQICAMVDKEGTPHDLIEIELTESAFFDDKDAMIKTINQLKSCGFLVSMDDFGSGYSSLNSLKDMPLDILKLDAGFFRGEEGNSRTEIVVSEAIRLAKCLDMKTVAEGVEEKAQVDFLATEGCDMIQGYYYAKPMPKEEYETRIELRKEEPQTEVEEPVQEETPNDDQVALAGVVAPIELEDDPDSEEESL